jgi:hypothetical protein
MVAYIRIMDLDAKEGGWHSGWYLRGLASLRLIWICVNASALVFLSGHGSAEEANGKQGLSLASKKGSSQ